MSAAVEVIGLVIEAMRKIVSRSIGSLASTSREPTHDVWTTFPPRQTSVAAPARAPSLTIAPTPLHRAAMGGHPDAVRVLLKFGADVNATDGMFSAPPLVWAVEGRSNTNAPGADHVEVARLLIAAGSPLEWTPPEGAPGPERTLEGLAQLKQAAAERGAD